MYYDEQAYPIDRVIFELAQNDTDIIFIETRYSMHWVRLNKYIGKNK